MKNIIFWKTADEDYRNEAARLLKEWTLKKAGSMNPAIVDDNTVTTLFKKVKPYVKKSLYYYVRRHNMLEETRILPHNAVEVVPRRHFRNIEYYAMPREYMDITSLVPDWKKVIADTLRQ